MLVFKRRIRWLNSLIIVYIALLAFQGNANIQRQLNIQGEFNNEPQEKLFRWIIENTPNSKLINIKLL